MANAGQMKLLLVKRGIKDPFIISTQSVCGVNINAQMLCLGVMAEIGGLSEVEEQKNTETWRKMPSARLFEATKQKKSSHRSKEKKSKQNKERTSAEDGLTDHAPDYTPSAFQSHVSFLLQETT